MDNVHIVKTDREENDIIVSVIRDLLTMKYDNMYIPEHQRFPNNIDIHYMLTFLCTMYKYNVTLLPMPSILYMYTLLNFNYLWHAPYIIALSFLYTIERTNKDNHHESHRLYNIQTASINALLNQSGHKINKIIMCKSTSSWHIGHLELRTGTVRVLYNLLCITLPPYKHQDRTNNLVCCITMDFSLISDLQEPQENWWFGFLTRLISSHTTSLIVPTNQNILIIFSIRYLRAN